MKKKWKRNCPECGEEIFYTRKDNQDAAEKRNTNCKSCNIKGIKHPMYGKRRSEETKQKIRESNRGVKRSKETRKNMSESKKGENNPFYGKRRSEETKQKIRESNKQNWKNFEYREMHTGKNHPMYGKKRSKEVRKKISESRKGIIFTDEHKKNCRLSAIKRIKKQNGQIMPNSNPNATLIIRAKAKELGITDLRDAETPGGEFQVCGYFVDGRSEEKNIVFEYYEKAHKYKKERDERRKREIIKELGCKFIVIEE